MSQKVVIKKNKFGITVVIEQDLTYEEIKKEVQEKFRQSAKFFKDVSESN